MTRCIYCTRDHPSDRFNREHVLPQAFGRFRHALTLKDTVCDECNSYFGRTLDRWLARGSSEGLERYRWGVRGPEKLRQFDARGMRFTVDEPGEYDGLVLEPHPGREVPGEGIQMVPSRQVGFTRADGTGWKWVTLEELEAGDFLHDPEIDVSQKVKMIPASASDDLLAALARQAVKKTKESEFQLPFESGGELSGAQVFAVGGDIERSIAKIAFNYFTKIVGSDEALNPAYDPIRYFVRYGRRPFLPIVKSNVPRLYRHAEEGKGLDPVAHYVILTWDRRYEVVICQVSLLGWMAHNVIVSFSVRNEVRESRSGHLFNIADWTVHNLSPISPDEVSC